ncbi:MAG: trigger factor, partial [Nitrospirae bacterium]|nr:trigger factor [Nitrospirota bacterium]
AEIVVKEKIQVVSRPKIKIEKDSPLTYTATVATMPEVEVKDHKSIKIKMKEVKVEKKDIEAVKTDMKKHGTQYKDVDRSAKKGDRAEVNFEGFDKEGKAIPNTKSQNHPVVLGGESLIPGFEDEIIGMKKDDKKEFDITFPKDYGKKDFQGKKVKFKVELLRVEEPTEPEINEEFIEKMTGKKQSIGDFEAEIEKNIKAKKETEAIRDRENQYIEELLKKVKVDVPETLIEEEAQYILQEMKEDIQMKGLEFEKFLEQSKTTEDDLRKKYTPEAEKRIKIRLALQYLIKEEKIEVSDDDLKAEVDKIKAQYPPAESDKIEKEYKEGKLKPQLTNKLALRKLFDKVLA